MKTTYIDAEDGGIFCTKDMGAAEVLKAETPDAPIVILLSTAAIDSDGDVVHQRKSKNGPGWDLERFNKAPVVTWQHDIWVPNLSGPKTRAKVQKHATKGFGLHITPLTFDVGDDFAMGLDGKIRRDVLKEFSAGFKILARESRKNEEGRTTGLDIYGSELIEAAVANRGANHETEVLAKNMLTRPGVARQAEGAGSATVDELKDELEELTAKFDLLLREVKTLGDAGQAQEVLRKKEHQTENRAAIKDAAAEMLKTLQTVGTAR